MILYWPSDRPVLGAFMGVGCACVCVCGGGGGSIVIFYIYKGLAKNYEFRYFWGFQKNEDFVGMKIFVDIFFFFFFFFLGGGGGGGGSALNWIILC